MLSSYWTWLLYSNSVNDKSVYSRKRAIHPTETTAAHLFAGLLSPLSSLSYVWQTVWPPIRHLFFFFFHSEIFPDQRNKYILTVKKLITHGKPSSMWSPYVLIKINESANWNTRTNTHTKKKEKKSGTKTGTDEKKKNITHTHTHPN